MLLNNPLSQSIRSVIFDIKLFQLAHLIINKAILYIHTNVVEIQLYGHTLKW